MGPVWPRRGPVVKSCEVMGGPSGGPWIASPPGRLGPWRPMDAKQREKHQGGREDLCPLAAGKKTMGKLRGFFGNAAGSTRLLMDIFFRNI